MIDRYCPCGQMLDRQEFLCGTCRLIAFEASVRLWFLRRIVRVCALRMAWLGAHEVRGV